MADSNSKRLPYDRKVLTRFFSKIEISTTDCYNGSPCWDWTASKNNAGYGMFQYSGGKRLAHRIAYGMFVEIIPSHLKGDHLCRRPICVNPAHKEPVTHRENVTVRAESPSGINSRKTHCKRGHELTGDNLYVVKNSGRRNCKTCATLNRRSRLKQKPHSLPTHCKHGHAFTPDNTITNKSSGWRRCRTCHNARRRKS